MPLAFAPTARRQPRNEPLELVVEGTTVLTLTPADGRVRVGLALPHLDRTIDISVQPATSLGAVVRARRDAGQRGESVEATARELLAAAARRSESWTPSADLCLQACFGGVSFPLLGAAYDLGADALREVPRWAAPVLAAPTVAQGAAVAFPSKATRPVRRALVEALRPMRSGEISLGQLALGLMGREVLQPDRIARVLTGDRAHHPLAALPESSTIHAARKAFNEWGDVRSERVLSEASARPDGLRVLLDTVGYALDLGHHGPSGRLPHKLTDLHDAYRVLVKSAADHEPAPAAPRRPRRPAAAPVVAEPLTVHRVLPPATSHRRVHSRTAIPASPRLLQLERLDVGDLRFIVPRTAGDLSRWGRLLGNCLQDFAPAATRGESIVVGVERLRRLAYVIEITPTGRIRQFSGMSNRRPSADDQRKVIGALIGAGVIRDPRL